jgi:Tfp pilus assembly protein FimV
MASRTIVLAGVAAVVIAGAGYWFLYMQDEAPPPPPPKPMAVAPKPAAAQPSAAATPSPAASAAPAPKDPASLDRELKATQSRVGELEKTMADLRNQIVMKDKEIAALEGKLAKPAAKK